MTTPPLAQFLFRNHNVGQSKSLSAVNAVRAMNADLKATPMQAYVSANISAIISLVSG